jgi:hypothetical protein
VQGRIVLVVAGDVRLVTEVSLLQLQRPLSIRTATATRALCRLWLSVTAERKKWTPKDPV